MDLGLAPFSESEMGQPEYCAFRLSLEDLGLYNLLTRIHHHQGEVDSLLRFGLAKRGLLIEDTPPRLSMLGLQELERLRELAETLGVEAEKSLGRAAG